MCRAADFLLALVFAVTQAYAADIEPRAYINTPVGLNFLILGYGYSDGGLSGDASSPIQDAQVRMHTGVFAYVRALDVWGQSGKVDFNAPYSNLSGSALVANRLQERKVSGFNDPRLRFSANLYGAPALSLKEFKDYEQDLIIGASVQVSLPLGQYDPEKLVNLGNNRWFIRPDLGMSKAWGALTMELRASATFFTDNEDYFANQTLEQATLFTTQAHASYSLGKGYWAAFSATYDYGGRSRTNGVENNDIQSNLRTSLTFAMPVSRKNSLKLVASTGVVTRFGANYTLLGLAWQYRWGAGL